MGKRVEPVSSSAAPAAPQGKPAKNRVCVARIGAPHGTRGEVRLWSFTASAEAVGAYGPLETADGMRAFEIETLRPARDFFVARLKGVVDRTSAEQLRNLELYVPRERLPIPEPDEFYHADLIGLEAQDTAGKAIGVVTGVHNFGAGDLLEIAPAAGGETVMVPFTAAAVPSVEIVTGRIIVDVPEELRESEFLEAGTLPSILGAKGNTGG
jgi:16S rRNA processing protein RimM